MGADAADCGCELTTGVEGTAGYWLVPRFWRLDPTEEPPREELMDESLRLEPILDCLRLDPTVVSDMLDPIVDCCKLDPTAD